MRIDLIAQASSGRASYFKGNTDYLGYSRRSDQGDWGNANLSLHGLQALCIFYPDLSYVNVLLRADASQWMYYKGRMRCSSLQSRTGTILRGPGGHGPHLDARLLTLFPNELYGTTVCRKL